MKAWSLRLLHRAIKVCTATKGPALRPSRFETNSVVFITKKLFTDVNNL